MFSPKFSNAVAHVLSWAMRAFWFPVVFIGVFSTKMCLALAQDTNASMAERRLACLRAAALLNNSWIRAGLAAYLISYRMIGRRDIAKIALWESIQDRVQCVYFAEVLGCVESKNV